MVWLQLVNDQLLLDFDSIDVRYNLDGHRALLFLELEVLTVLVDLDDAVDLRNAVLKD